MKKKFTKNWIYTSLICLWAFTGITTINAQQPTISSFSPSSGSVGSLVTITGTNLSNPTALTITGVPVITTSNTGTSLVVMVMPGTVTGTISITTTSGTATSANSFTVLANQAPSTQQGSKLIGSGAIGTVYQGISVAVSADGNTAIVGGFDDNGNIGAAWVYTRSGGNWTQHGSKLIGSGAVGAASQGYSVAISADGNTAIVGGINDNNYIGAVWVYTRSGGNWTQQGSKLVVTDAVGRSQQGQSISISADGNTAIVGGGGDNFNIGAAWVYTRSGGNWTQQGSKLVGTGAVGTSSQGQSVSISADGNTAIVGGNGDNNALGAAWVYTGSGGNFTQQGNKLVGTGTNGSSYQGYSVAISADGNTAIVGGIIDNNHIGAAWVYTRNSGNWTQQGSKLVGSGAVGTANQGQSVSISADGNTAIVGGDGDNNYIGAAWVYTRSSGNFTQQGSKLVGSGAVGTSQQGYSVAISADGNTALVGGYGDNSHIGAAWVYTSATLSTNADLSGMSISAGTLTPTFVSATTAYTASVSNATTNVTVTPTRYDANATIQVRVNGGTYATVTSGSASSALSLNVGSNTIDVTVTAQDNTTIKTYTITVTRAASTNADLSSLTTTAGSLTPAFAVATLGYTTSILNAPTNITVTPTIADATATVQVRVNGGTYATVASGSASALSLIVGSNTIDVKVTAQDGTTIKTYTITIRVIQTSAGSDQTLLCGSATKTVSLTGSPVGGTWSSSGTNNATAVLGTTQPNGTVIVTLPLTPFTGNLNYIYTANTFTSNVTVHVNGPVSPTININSGSPVLCNGSTVQLCPLNWGYSNYQWYRDGYAIAGATGVSSCITLDALGIGSYTLAGTNGSGCWSVPSAPLVVSTVNSLSKPTITVTGATALCNGGSTLLTSSATYGNQWFKNGNATGVTTQAYTVSDPANYSVLVSNGNCASAISLTTIISGNVAPASISGATTVVAGSTTQLTSATSGGVWTSNSSVATVSTNGLVTGVTAGSATITYTVMNSCGSSSVTQPLTVTGACIIPVANFTIANSNQCLTSNSFSFSNTSTGTTPTYIWNFGDGIGSATTTAAGYSYTAANTYTVTLTASNGCGSNQTTQTVTVTTLPATPASIGGATTVVAGSTTQLTSATSGGVWTSNSSVATVSTNGLVTGVIAGSATITYTVMNSCGSSSVTQPMTVTGACIIPVANFTIANSNQCLTSNSFSFSNTSTGTTPTYTWYFGDGASMASNNATHTYTAAGPYTVTLTAVNGCGTTTKTSSVTVNTVPATPASIGGATSVVVGSTTQLSSGTSGGAWTSNNLAVATADVNTGLVTGVTAGSAIITYTVMNSCGSSSVTQPMTVTTACVAPVANFTIANATQCLATNSFSFSNTSTGTTPTTYKWYFGDGGFVASQDATHTYTSGNTYNVLLTADNACGSTSITQTVTVNATPATPASISGATSVVVGSTTPLTSSTLGGAWTSSNSLVAMVSTNGLVTGVTAGSCTITYTVMNSCGSSSVTQPMTVTTACVAPVADFTIANATQCFNGNNFTFTNASSGTQPTTYKWYFGDGGFMASQNATHSYGGNYANTYNVLLTADNACGSTSITKTVTVNAVPPTPASIGGATIVAVGATTQLTSGTPSGVWTSNSAAASVNPSTGLVTGVSVGSATITYTVTNGCGSSSVSQFVTVTSAAVTVSPNPATSNMQVIFTAPTTTGFTIYIINSSNTTVSTTIVGSQTIGSTVSSNINVSTLSNGMYFISIYDTIGHLISTTQVLKN